MAQTTLVTRFVRRVLDHHLPEALMSEPAVTAKYYPDRTGQSSRPLSTDGVGDGAPDVPVPPRELWMCGERSPVEYLDSGQEHVRTMLRILEDCGYWFRPGSRVLDFGCAAGRMIRWLRPHALESEIWGVDIQQRLVGWCQQHLSPPFSFVTTTTFPHLPFEDNHFELIYCGSVFTHISELADTWLLELRRVLAPGGLLYVTVNDNHSVDLILDFPPGHRLHWLREWVVASGQADMLRTGRFSFATIRHTPLNSVVIYDRGYLERMWSRVFRIRAVVPEVYDVQTAIVLEKPRRVS